MKTLQIIVALMFHQWKSTVRSVSRRRDVASKAMVGVMMVLIMLNLLGIGFYLDQFLEMTAAEVDPVHLLSAGVFYYLLADLVLRFFLQKMPVQTIQPYLITAVRRNHLVHLLLIRSIFSFFNLLPLLVIIPFVLNIGTQYHSGFGMLSWTGTLIVLLLCNSYLNFYLKKQLLTNVKIVIGIAGVLAGLICIDYLGLFSLSNMSETVFTFLLEYPMLFMISVLLLFLLYSLNFRFIKFHLYLETLSPGRLIRTGFSGFQFLSQLGEIGLYLALELKLLFRNKRSRATLWFSLAVLPLGVVIYPMIPLDRTDFYPVPGMTKAHLGNSDNSDERIDRGARVTFSVIPEQQPEDTYVYIAGNHTNLGSWDTGAVPLSLESDSSWSVSLIFPEGTELRYKFTLGTWETEAVTREGKKLEAATLTVRNDTTVTTRLAGFKLPRRHILMDINLIYFGLMLTGMFLLAYGQFVFGWESNYFDLLLSEKIHFRSYLQSKFWFLSGSVVILYLILLPYSLISTYLLYIHASLALYNIGINSMLVLFLSTYTRHRVDLTASILGTQGKGGAQYLTVLPTLILPILILIPLHMTVPDGGVIAVFGALGIIGIILHRWLLNLLIAQMSRQKYRLAAAFRQV